MALIISSLGAGKLKLSTDTEANRTLYTAPVANPPSVPNSRVAILKNMRFVNTHSGGVTMNLYIKRVAPAGTHRISPVNMNLASGYQAIDDDEVTLAPGDKILGEASDADKIEFVISGVERDT
jgi:hypothetical protein